MDQKKIGLFIATCRKKKGLTQKQLAEKLSVTCRAYHHIVGATV